MFELGPVDGLEAWPEYAERFPGELLGADAGLIGASDAARGRFAAAQGDLDRAVELLEAGHALHERLELPQLSVESGLDLGIVLLRRDGPGDGDRAMELSRATAELASAIGMIPSEARARAAHLLTHERKRTMSDAASTMSVTRTIDAPAEHAWSLISDVTRMGEWSPETTSAEWLSGATAPAQGAKFRGTNSNGKKSWKSVATIVDAQPGRTFAFRVKAMGLDIAEWRYTFESTPTGCVVTESWTDRRGGFLKMMSPKVTGVADRAEHNRSGMETTLERLAAAAESTPPSG